MTFPLLVCMLWMNSAPLYAYILPLNGYPKLELNGNNSITYNDDHVTGSTSFYADDNLGHDTTFTQSSNLHLTGDIIKNLSVDATYLADHYAPNKLNWHLRYNGKYADVLVGDFTANLAGNEFVLLNRTLSGVQIDAKLPKGTFTALTSSLQASVRTDIIPGRGIVGPYNLTATPVVDGSEVVSVNNQKMVRGTDYTLDYTNGLLNFTTPVQANFNITISYEVQDNGLGGGQLYAIRVAYPVLNNLKVGFSRLQLTGSGQTQSQRSERDQLYGDGTPGPFTLTYRPVVPESETVKINGILQARNIAYTISYDTGQLRFNKGYEPPSGTSVIIDYQTMEQGAGGTDRSITGVDVDWQVVHGLTLNMQLAKSDGTTTVTTPALQISAEPIIAQSGPPLTQQTFQLQNAPILPGSEKVVDSNGTQLVNGVDYTLNYLTGQLHLLRDTIPIPQFSATLLVSYSTQSVTSTLQGDSAMSVGANYNKGKVQATARYRQVAPGFSPLQSVGNLNILHGLDWTGHYAFTNYLGLTVNGSDNTQPYNPYAVSTSNQILMHELDQTYALDYSKPNMPSFSLRRSSQDSTQDGSGALGRSSTTDSLNINWTHQAFNANLNLNRIDSNSRQLNYSSDPNEALPDNPQLSDAITRFVGTTNNASLVMNFRPNDRFNLGANLAMNDTKGVQDGTNSSSRGDNVSLNAMFKPAKTLTLNASLQKGKTDAATTSSGSSVPAQSTQSLTFGANWQGTKNFSLSANYTNNNSQGGDNSDSTTNTLSTNARWAITERVKLDGYWSHQTLQYLDNSGTSDSNMIGLNSQLGPIIPLGKSTIDLGFQHLWGGSTSVNNLSNTVGQSMNITVSPSVSSGPTVTGNELTTLSAKITYPIIRRHELFVSGEVTSNGGSPSQSQKISYATGWNYHLNTHFTLTMSAGRVIYKDQTTPGLDYKADQLNAQLAWNF